MKFVPIPGRRTPEGKMPSVFIGDIDPAYWVDTTDQASEFAEEPEGKFYVPIIKPKKKKKTIRASAVKSRLRPRKFGRVGGFTLPEEFYPNTVSGIVDTTPVPEAGRFESGAGPSVSNAFPNPLNYTIEMLFTLDATSDGIEPTEVNDWDGYGIYTKLVDFKDLAIVPDPGETDGNTGILALGSFYGAKIQCIPMYISNPRPILGGVPCHLVMTRDGLSNQWLCYADGVNLNIGFIDDVSVTTVPEPVTAPTGPNNVIHFFRESWPVPEGDLPPSGGVVHRIRIYSEPLSPADVVTLFEGGSVSDELKTYDSQE